MTTDYTTSPLMYRLKKVVRYTRMYGPRRTLEKVRGQYHMKVDGDALATDWQNTSRRTTGPHDVAIVGCGNFAYSNIAYYCNSIRPGSIRCAYDPIGGRAISLIHRYGGQYAAADAMRMLDDPAVRTVFIASNHSTHADYGIEAIRRGKVVHIEKPHVVNHQQLERLIGVLQACQDAKVFLGFNRPRSAHFARIQSALLLESGPVMVNWFVAGHELDPSHWYFSDAEGGRILGNLCHWTDLTLRLVGLECAFPIQIAAEKPDSSESDYAVTMAFGNGSIGMISFSAKGHTFEGVREYLNVHRGNALISLRDFHETTFDVGHVKTTYSPLFRDHGHRAAIEATLDGGAPEGKEMIIESARIFLAVKDAVDSGRRVVLHPYQA